MKTALKLVGRSTLKTLKTLECALVNNGMLQTIDMDMTITCPVPLRLMMADGIYDVRALRQDMVLVAGQHTPADWPELPPRQDLIVQSAFINPEELETLKWVSLAMSNEETRYYLCGVVFRNGLIEATDGHRLHRAPSGCSTPDDTLAAIVPAKAVKLLLDLAKEYQPQTVGVTWYDNRAVFTVGPATLETKLIDGTFPDTDRVIPDIDPKAKKVAFDPAIFKAALPKVRALKQSAPGQKGLLAIKFESDGAASIVTWVENKKGKTSVPVCYPLPGISLDLGYSVGLSCGYLAELCPGTMQAGAGKGDPIRIDGHNDRLSVIMPIRHV